jgi:hypothetical protein
MPPADNLEGPAVIDHRFAPTLGHRQIGQAQAKSISASPAQSLPAGRPDLRIRL